MIPLILAFSLTPQICMDIGEILSEYVQEDIIEQEEANDINRRCQLLLQ